MNRKHLIAVYTFNQSFHWLTIGILIPVTTLLKLEKGLDLFQVGILAAVHSATVMLLELPTGGLADSIGRKRVYLISLAALFCSALVILFAWNFAFLALGFFLMGVARALSSGSIDAWFVDELSGTDPDANLQDALAKAGTFIPFGLGSAALLGGILPMTLGKLTKQIPLAGFGVYSSNVIVFALFVAIQFVLTSILVREGFRKGSGKGVLRRSIREVPGIVSSSISFGIRKPFVFLLLVSSLAWGFGFSGLEGFWQPRIKELLGSDSQTWIFGVLTAGYFFAGSFGNLISTRFCRLFRNNYGIVLFVLRAAMGTLFVILALQADIALFALFYLATFMTNGMSNSPHGTLFNTSIPNEKRSTLLSLDSLFMQTGALAGSILLGLAARNAGIPVSWFMAGGILAFSSLCYLFLPKNKG